MTKEEFNTKYKDKFRINDDCDLEQWIECDCEHCQECKYSTKQWIESIFINGEFEMICDYVKYLKNNFSYLNCHTCEEEI
ncbi:hypothetical protein M1771_05610 [Spiroplasma citri]|uniref:Uncharacterized protein n=1 Tax=Spiroplasma citri TaxID=2133 RepID=Q14MI9_SPICI|nr:hypothetical protein [Spiroplasma citri]WFG95579.1 hypothetical protein M0C40_05645 [Spiroplasma citri]WFG99467.1 hypothetical protein M1771_05610 [Spiroplasma citri]CAK99290.1 hypothetical protein SPICI10_011 [Spiroplasma citri]